MNLMNLLMESVVIAFTLGAVVGGVVAIHLIQPKKETSKLAEQTKEQALEP